jgi:hypothetical protein
MIAKTDYIADIQQRIEELERSIALFEDGTMQLFQGPSPTQLTEITAEHLAHLKQTKADYELILRKFKA